MSIQSRNAWLERLKGALASFPAGGLIGYYIETYRHADCVPRATVDEIVRQWIEAIEYCHAFYRALGQ